MLVASERPLSAYGYDVRFHRTMAQTLPTESCKHCALRQFCSMNPGELACTREMDDLVLAHRQIKKGEALYRAGDAFKNLYAVRAGSFKKLTLLPDGREQVTGFYLSGEPLGLDGISNGQCASDAIALEDSSVCVMPFELLELLSREVRAVQHHVYRLLSAEVVRESSLMLLLGTMTADERVASFLLDLSRRFQMRAYSPTQFVLRMTREEIGSFLGIKLETVSRSLSRLQKEGLIEVNGRNVRILNSAALQKAEQIR